MAFQPNPGDEITVNGIVYTVGTHPAAPGMAYAQVGRQGAVYQLVPKFGDPADTKALKIFVPKFRIPSLVHQSELMERYAGVPGLRVCRREVLIPERNSSLIARYPDLLYAVLMPWIHGYTWMDVMTSDQDMTPEESLAAAKSLAAVGSAMEQRGVAHCDLSAPNVMFRGTSFGAIELVDVEQLYSPRLDPPDFYLTGSPGYASNSQQGMAASPWNPYADRFSGAVILAEMLGWCDSTVREEAWGESYFDPQEIQDGSSSRFELLVERLKELWGPKPAELFSRAWNSLDARSCPTFGEWLVILSSLQEQGGKTEVSEVIAVTSESVPEEVTIEPTTKQQMVIDSSVYGEEQVAAETMEIARQLESEGNLTAALAQYKEARSLAKQGGALQTELETAVQSLMIKTTLTSEGIGSMVPDQQTAPGRSVLNRLKSWQIIAIIAGLLVAGSGIYAASRTWNGDAGGGPTSSIAAIDEQKSNPSSLQGKDDEKSQSLEKKQSEEQKKREEEQKKLDAKKQADALKAKKQASAIAAAKAAQLQKQRKEQEEKAKQAALAQQEAEQKKAEQQKAYKQQEDYNRYLAWKKDRDTRLAKEKQAKKTAERKAALERELKEVERRRKEKALQKTRDEDITKMIAYYNSAYNAQKTGQAALAKTYASKFLAVYNKDPKYYVKNGKIGKRVAHIYRMISKSKYQLPDI